MALGLELQLTTRELEILQDAGALHDIGKIGVSKEILNKPGPLTDAEYNEVKKHPIYGYNILRPLDLPEVLDITRMHHERLDGKGYPDGVTDYPPLVRVLQVADVWDALTSDRPYRKGMSVTAALCADGPRREPVRFDPDILRKFLRMTEYIFPEMEDTAFDQMRLALHVTQGLKATRW